MKLLILILFLVTKICSAAEPLERIPLKILEGTVQVVTTNHPGEPYNA